MTLNAEESKKVKEIEKKTINSSRLENNTPKEKKDDNFIYTDDKETTVCNVCKICDFCNIF